MMEEEEGINQLNSWHFRVSHYPPFLTCGFWNFVYIVWRNMDSTNDSALRNLLQTTAKQNPHNTIQPLQPAVTPIVEPKDVQHEVKLQNVVATVSVACELNLQDINFRTRNSEYTPSRFHGVVMRMREPRCTALIFRTGKIICTGARNEAEASLGARKFARILQKLGYPVKFVDFKLQNIVATVDLRFPIRLENLNQMHGQFSSYEPELFPGLIYRMVNPRMVLLIFVNGKIVFTGAKARKDIMECLDKIYPTLLSFRKN